MVAKRKKMLHWVIPCLTHPWHRDMKIMKILASNSKQFRVYGIFKKGEIDGDRGQPNT